MNNLASGALAVHQCNLPGSGSVYCSNFGTARLRNSYTHNSPSSEQRSPENLTCLPWNRERSLAVDLWLWLQKQPIDDLTRRMVVGHWALPP